MKTSLIILLLILSVMLLISLIVVSTKYTYLIPSSNMRGFMLYVPCGGMSYTTSWLIIKGEKNGR